MGKGCWKQLSKKLKRMKSDSAHFHNQKKLEWNVLSSFLDSALQIGLSTSNSICYWTQSYAWNSEVSSLKILHAVTQSQIGYKKKTENGKKKKPAIKSVSMIVEVLCLNDPASWWNGRWHTASVMKAMHCVSTRSFAYFLRTRITLMRRPPQPIPCRFLLGTAHLRALTLYVQALLSGAISYKMTLLWACVFCIWPHSFYQVCNLTLCYSVC